MTLLKKYLLNSVCFEAPNDQGTKEKTKQELAAEERNKINVIQSEEKDAEGNVITEEQKAARQKEIDDATAAKKAEEDAAKKATEETEKKNNEEETEEEETDPVKLKATIARLQKRIGTLTNKNKLTENEKTELANKLSELEKTEGKNLLTEEDVETRAETKATQKLAERQFVEDCNKLAEAGNKINKNFDKQTKETTDEFGPIPGTMIGVLSDLDNGGAVLNYLMTNSDDYERTMSMSPGKMGVELAKISNKVIENETKKNAEKKVAERKEKELSKVPDHNEPPTGTQKVDSVLRDTDDMNDWVKKRNAQVAEARRLGRNVR